MQTRQHLFLIGFMGCGKSFWGRKLAHSLQMPFVDLDELIALKVGKSIPEIFASEGESGFRIWETQVLQSLEADERALIVASGGGTPCFHQNLQLMHSMGSMVYLQTEIPVLLERLMPEKTKRPLLTGLKDDSLEVFLREKLAQREPFYLQATHVLQQKTGKEDLMPDLLRIYREQL